MDLELEAYAALAISYALNVVYALIILIAGFWLAKLAKRLVRGALERTGRVDATVTSFLSNLVRYGVLAIVIIAVLTLFGVETTSLIAVLGAASLAIGLALQGTLSNVAAGVMILLFRPFKLGDFVIIGGESGTVKDINLFLTELATPDNVQIIVPNSSAWGNTVTNYSAHATRRVDLTIGIDYSDDADKALEIIRGLIEGDERAHAEPAPFLAVTNLGDSSVDLTLRVWTDSKTYWPLKFHLTKAIKEAFDAASISIPFPHQVMITRSE